LASLTQGEKMFNHDYHIVGSSLTVNASGVEQMVAKDLELQDGKSIAELLNDQEKENEKDETSK